MPTLNTGNAILSNAITVDSSYNVGIGQASPSYKLDVSGTGRFTGALTAASGAFGSTSISSTTIQNSGNFYLGTSAATFLQFFTNNADRMIITSSGNVGISTTSPSSLGNLTVVMPSASNGTGIVIKAINDGGSASQPALTYLNGSGNYIAQIVADNGTGYLGFNTGTSNTERGRFTSAGKFLVSTSLNGASISEFSNPNTNGYGLYVSAGTGGNWVLYAADYAGNGKFFVNASGTIYAVNTSVQSISSDIALKTNVRDYDMGLAEILKMKPRIYDRKDGSNDNEIGFIAQEMDEALPNSMKDGMPDKNGDVYKTYEVNWYPLLVKAIQEMNTRIDQQQQTINSLINR